MANDKPKPAPVVIKKYANRRLYNTATSAYVTLESLADLTRQNIDFVVFDAKSGEDITRSVLTQIIFDEENNGSGKNLLPVEFLRQLIGFYGDSMQAFVPSYLEMAMRSFAEQQARLRGTVADAFSGKAPTGFFEEAMRNNMAFFDQATKMFSPFASTWAANAAKTAETRPPTANADPSLNEMKEQLAEMQKKLDDLAKR